MNYPDGMNKLPDDEIYACDVCGVKDDHEGYDECPSCGEHSVCNSCLYCSKCSTQFHECECGSGELTDADSCSQCFDEEYTPSEVDVECPECHLIANSEAWDEQTQNIFGADCEPLSRAIVDRDPTEEFWYICPHCLEQVDLDDMKKAEEEE